MEKTKISAIEKMFAEKKARKIKKITDTNMSDVAKKNKSIKSSKSVSQVKSARAEKMVATGAGEEKAVAGKNIHKEKTKIKKSRIIIVSLLMLIIVGAGAVTVRFYRQPVESLAKQQAIVTENDLVQTEPEATIATVGKLFELPTDETPSLIIVTDVERNSGQKFFTKAQDGDRVLTYTVNDKMILFRPAQNKIIEVAQISGMNNDGAVSSADSIKKQTAPVIAATTAVYNGSNVSKLAQKIAEKIGVLTEINVTEKTNAVGNYEKTLVVDLSGSHAELAQKIAELLGGEVGSLPVGEKKPQSEMLVIGGSNFKAN